LEFDPCSRLGSGWETGSSGRDWKLCGRDKNKKPTASAMGFKRGRISTPII